MTREERSVSLVILTLIVYSAFMYFDKGAVLFPYPLNEALFLFVAFQFFWWRDKKYSIDSLLPVFTGIVNLLSTQFFWSLFFDTQKMEILTSGPTLDIAKLLFYLFIGVWAVSTIWTIWPKNPFALIGTLAVFALPIFYPIPIVEVIPIVPITLISWNYKAQSPNHLLWILLCSLQIMKIAMIYLM